VPLYLYTCDKCDHEFETLVTAASASEVECPECQSKRVRRGFGVPARPAASHELPATNCRGDGPPCGLPQCGRRKL
jgi:putative FmdB family regulatory protein